MSDDRKLPVPAEEPPRKATWLDDVDTHIIEVTRHDKNDIVFGRQYFVLMLEDAEDGRFLTTRVSSPVTTSAISDCRDDDHRSSDESDQN